MTFKSQISRDNTSKFYCIYVIRFDHYLIKLKYANFTTASNNIYITLDFGEYIDEIIENKVLTFHA